MVPTDIRCDGAMSELGQTQKSGRATGKSALPSRTDIVSLACQVRKVPKTHMDPYSITSSALAGSVAGIVRPSALTALRLMISW